MTRHPHATTTATATATATKLTKRTLAQTAALHARAMTATLLGLAALHSSKTWAHDGHGLGGSHWHASDSFGLLLGAAAVAAVWLWKGRP